MPRFYLTEFNTPNYRESLPEHDPNNAIWPRITAFAKMLHDISWKDDGGSTQNDDFKTQEENDRLTELEAQRMDDPLGLTKSERADREAERMKGYYTENEALTENMVLDSFGGNSTSLDKAKAFDPKTAKKKDIEKMQKLVGTNIDGAWGNASQAALENFINSNEAELAKYGAASKLYNERFGDNRVDNYGMRTGGYRGGR